MCIDIVEIWFGIAIVYISSFFDRVIFFFLSRAVLDIPYMLNSFTAIGDSSRLLQTA